MERINDMTSAARTRGVLIAPTSWSTEGIAVPVAGLGYDALPVRSRETVPTRNHVAANAAVPAVGIFQTMKSAKSAAPPRGVPR
jgi:hypothetical protein